MECFNNDIPYNREMQPTSNIHWLLSRGQQSGNTCHKISGCHTKKDGKFFVRGWIIKYYFTRSSSLSKSNNFWPLFQYKFVILTRIISFLRGCSVIRLANFLKSTGSRGRNAWWKIWKRSTPPFGMTSDTQIDAVRNSTNYTTSDWSEYQWTTHQ